MDFYDAHRKCADYAAGDPDYLCSRECPAMDVDRRARIEVALRRLFPNGG